MCVEERGGREMGGEKGGKEMCTMPGMGRSVLYYCAGACGDR